MLLVVLEHAQVDHLVGQVVHVPVGVALARAQEHHQTRADLTHDLVVNLDPGPGDALNHRSHDSQIFWAQNFSCFTPVSSGCGTASAPRVPVLRH